MYRTKGLQPNRKYEDYAGQPACQGCIVLDNFVCPLVEKAFERGVKMTKCPFLRPFAEKLAENIISGYTRNKS